MDEDPRRARKRWARGLLVVGAALLTLVGSRAVPKEQPIRVRVDPSDKPRQVTLQWERPGDEPIGGATLSIQAGISSVQHTLTLPDGKYVLHIGVSPAEQLPGSVAPAVRTFRLELNGAATTLHFNHQQ